MMCRHGQADPKVRLFVAAELDAGRLLALTEGQGHYLTRVMRLGLGGTVRIFNGHDGEWLGRIEHLPRGAVSVRVEQLVRAQVPEGGPWLAFAPVKKSATDYIVEKATELGASRIWPVMTERTIAARINLDRLKVIAVEAAEQCGRLSLPELAQVTTLAEFAADWPPERPLLVAHTGGGTQSASILDALLELAPPASASGSPAAGFLVGPEGGLTHRDLDVLVTLPCARVVRLGPRTLRAETAAAALLACWQAVAGDWRGSGAPPAS